MEVSEVLFSPNLQGVRKGGFIGTSDGRKVACIVYQQPADGDFILMPTTAPVPRMTARKLRNRKYRQGRAGRDLTVDGLWVGADGRQRVPKRRAR